MPSRPDLLQSVYADAQLHEQFKRVRDLESHTAARAMLRKVHANFDDPDGNFIEQFQTAGFDQRTFELYLFALFQEADLTIDRSHDRPDFLLTKNGSDFCVEAVTANPSSAKPYDPFPKDRDEGTQAEYLADEVSIRLGSPLYSKLSKRYWELPHVTGKPLILAIQNFQQSGSLGLSESTLASYLFGIGQFWYHDAAGELKIHQFPRSTHELGTKSIPSGFFHQPSSEFISAVLFTNQGTMAKFSRMGVQKGCGSRMHRAIRFGTCFDPTPNADRPDIFLYEVGDPEVPMETWAQGSVLIHNPNALYPISPGIVGTSAEMTWTDERVVTTFHEAFHPYSSMMYWFHVSTPPDQIESWCAQMINKLEKGMPW